MEAMDLGSISYVSFSLFGASSPLVFFIFFLGIVASYFWGFRLYVHGLQLSLGVWAKSFLAPSGRSQFESFLKGMGIGLLVQCVHVGVRFLFGLANARLVSFQKGARLFFGVLLAPLFLWTILIVIPPKWGVVFLILSLIPLLVFPVLIRREKNGDFQWSESDTLLFSWDQVARTLAGIGLLFASQALALELWGVYQSVSLSSQEALGWFPKSEFTNSFAVVNEFLRIWVIFFFIGIFFRGSIVSFGGAWFFSTLGHWSFVATVAFVSASFLATVVVEQGGFKKSGDGAKEFIRFFLLLGVAFSALDILILISLLGGGIDAWSGWNSSYFLVFYYAFRLLLLASLYFIFERFMGNRIYRLVKTLASTEFVSEPDRFLILGRPTDLVPSLALVQVRTQIEKLKVDVDLMMGTVRAYVSEGPSARVMAEIKKLEDSTDQNYADILEYVRGIQINPLTPHQSLEAQVLVTITYELEKITDYLDKIAIYSTRFNGDLFPDSELENSFWNFWDDIENYYRTVTEGIVGELRAVDSDDSELSQTAREIKARAEKLKEQNLTLAQERAVNPAIVQNYSDMIMALKKIRAHTYSIYQQLSLVSS